MFDVTCDDSYFHVPDWVKTVKQVILQLLIDSIIFSFQFDHWISYINQVKLISQKHFVFFASALSHFPHSFLFAILPLSHWKVTARVFCLVLWPNMSQNSTISLHELCFRSFSVYLFFAFTGIMLTHQHILFESCQKQNNELTTPASHINPSGTLRGKLQSLLWDFSMRGRKTCAL